MKRYRSKFEEGYNKRTYIHRLEYEVDILQDQFGKKISEEDFYDAAQGMLASDRDLENYIYNVIPRVKSVSYPLDPVAILADELFNLYWK